MSAPRVALDFVSRRRPLTLTGGVLLALGAAALTATYLEYCSIEAHRAGIETKLQAFNRRSQRDPAQELRAAALSEEAGRVAESNRIASSTTCASPASRVTCRACSPTCSGCGRARGCVTRCSRVTM